MKILCIIPARSGSKGVPNKNIKKFRAKPMLAWSIEHAQKSKYNMKIVVSTDSEEYAKIARKYGAETPFLRPSDISQDLSPCSEFINHCIKWLKENQNYNSDIILHLRPTAPFRKPEDIDKCLDIFIKNIENYDSLRTVIPADKTPYKTYNIQNNKLIPLFTNINGINESYNQARQILPKTYLHNGYIDIIKTKIIKEGRISGENIYPYVMTKNDKFDIDTLDDWKNATNI